MKHRIILLRLSAISTRTQNTMKMLVLKVGHESTKLGSTSQKTAVNRLLHAIALVS